MRFRHEMDRTGKFSGGREEVHGLRRGREGNCCVRTAFRAGITIARRVCLQGLSLIGEGHTMTTDEPTVHDWLGLIRAEYLEMPGLHLTKKQMQRLWNLESHLCDVLVDALVAADFLKETSGLAYMLAEENR
jgi:hypothetical protein